MRQFFGTALLALLASVGAVQIISKDNKFTLDWTLNATHIDFSVVYRNAPPQPYWFAIGLHEDPEHATMKDTDFLVVEFTKRGNCTVSDRFGQSAAVPPLDTDLQGRNDVMNTFAKVCQDFILLNLF
jgi:hypothetical protein